MKQNDCLQTHTSRTTASHRPLAVGQYARLLGRFWCQRFFSLIVPSAWITFMRNIHMWPIRRVSQEQCLPCVAWLAGPRTPSYWLASRPAVSNGCLRSPLRLRLPGHGSCRYDYVLLSPLIKLMTAVLGWNICPPHLRHYISLSLFKTSLKTIVFTYADVLWATVTDPLTCAIKTVFFIIIIIFSTKRRGGVHILSFCESIDSILSWTWPNSKAVLCSW